MLVQKVYQIFTVCVSLLVLELLGQENTLLFIMNNAKYKRVLTCWSPGTALINNSSQETVCHCNTLLLLL